MPVSLSQILGVVLALAVVYYILALMVSALTQIILDTFETRGKVFEDFLKGSLVDGWQNNKSTFSSWIGGFFDRVFSKASAKNAKQAENKQAEENSYTRLMQLPQINALRPVRYKYLGLGILTGSTKLSEYVERISAKQLVDALFDLKGEAESQQKAVENVIEMLPNDFVGLNGEKISFKATKDSLKAIAGKPIYSFKQWHEKLETIYGNILDQAAQQFKAKARQLVVIFSLLIAFILGVDSIEIARRAWYDAAYAKQFDVAADQYVKAQSGNTEEAQPSEPGLSETEALEKMFTQLETLQVVHIPFWETNSQSSETDLSLLTRILGILITGIAVSQGSSFWYDIIRQIKGERKTSDSTSKEVMSSFLDDEIRQRDEAVMEPPAADHSYNPPSETPPQ